MASVALAGSIAQRPRRGGHAWVFLNHMIGLRSLDHEVLFVDRLSAEMLAEPDAAAALAHSPEARWLHEVMCGAGFSGDYVLLADDDGNADARRRLLDRLSRTDLLINVNGFLDDPELLDAPAVTAFLDIDPAIQQMWVELGLADVFGDHDLYFTVGRNIGSAPCAVPTCGREWLPVAPAVAIDQWPASPQGAAVTSVASWRGPYGSIEYEGETYGLRAHEFRRFMTLPSRYGGDLTIALDIDPTDRSDLVSLRSEGWKLLDPAQVADTPDAYRSFVQGSKVELAIAKNVYVRSRCGWFSDRSACYLASGKPVVAQETGFSAHLPTGEGLLAFTDSDEAAAALEEVDADPARHARAARALACEHLDARRVLGGMLDAAGI